MLAGLQQSLGAIALLSSTMTIGLKPWRTMVDSSMPVIWKAPSPTSTIGRSSGRRDDHPHAAGTAKPIDV